MIRKAHKFTCRPTEFHVACKVCTVLYCIVLYCTQCHMNFHCCVQVSNMNSLCPSAVFYLAKLSLILNRILFEPVRLSCHCHLVLFTLKLVSFFLLICGIFFICILKWPIDWQQIIATQGQCYFTVFIPASYTQ